MKRKLLFCFYIIFVTLNNANQAKAEIAFSFDNVNLVSVMNIISQEISSNIIEKMSGDKLNESSIKAVVEEISKKNIGKYL